MSDTLQVGQISRLADGRHQGKMTHVYEGHSAAAIWAMLAGALEGVPMKFPFQLFLDARKAYSQQLA